MRDVTDRRKAYDRQRAELLAAYSGVYDVDRAARATEALRRLLRDERAPVPITIPVPEDIGPSDKVYPPTADQVAAAIIAACKETGADPLRVGAGDLDDKTDRSFKISRARTYAALAIRAIFVENTATSIANMVGAGYGPQYLSQIDARMKNNDLKWFDNDAFMRVVAATEESV